MKLSKDILIIIGLLLMIGCQKMILKQDNTIAQSETPPEWAQKILSRTVNLNALEGSWIYSSVIVYNNSECSGDSESYDFSGTISYDVSEANRTQTVVYSYSDFEDKIDNYSIDNFRSDCVAKGGVINSEGYCEMNDEETLEYYLVDGGGYCEVYIKEDESITYCGSIFFNGNNANISFTWNTDKSKWDYEGCKDIQLNSQN